MQVQYILSGI